MKPFPSGILARCRSLAVEFAFEAELGASPELDSVHLYVPDEKRIREYDKVVVFIERRNSAAARDRGAFNLPIRFSLGDGETASVLEMDLLRGDVGDDALVDFKCHFVRSTRDRRFACHG